MLRKIFLVHTLSEGESITDLRTEVFYRHAEAVEFANKTDTPLLIQTVELPTREQSIYFAVTDNGMWSRGLTPASVLVAVLTETSGASNVRIRGYKTEFLDDINIDTAGTVYVVPGAKCFVDETIDVSRVLRRAVDRINFELEEDLG